MRSYIRDGFDIVGAQRRIGRTNRKIVIHFMHEVLNVIVVLQEPLKGVGQVIKEEGARNGIASQRGGGECKSCPASGCRVARGSPGRLGSVISEGVFDV